MDKSPLYKGIIIAKSDQHLSDMWLKLWLLGDWQWVTVRFGHRTGYSLLDPVDIGDFVELYDNGGPIRKLTEPTLPQTKKYDGARCSLKIKVNFMPLDYLLFPASAKNKNLRMAMTAELGPIPLAKPNSFKLHTFYKGLATLFFTKSAKEQKIETVYKTPWLICNDGETLDHSTRSTVVTAFNFCQALSVLRQGLVVDASLKDVFFLQCAEFPEMVSLRKDITDGLICVGDWVEFIALHVREAEKSDDAQLILPSESDKMSFFERRIACCPVRIAAPFPTSISGGKTQLTVAIRVPINPPCNGIYAVERLGEVGDPKRLIGMKHEGRTITVSVQCKVNIEQKRTTFTICDTEREREKPPVPSVAPAAPAPAQCRGTFLQNIERAQCHQKQQLRMSQLTTTTTNTTTKVSSGRRAEGAAPVTDENADPKTNGTAFWHLQQQQQQHQLLFPSPPPPPSATLAPRRKPTNCIELDTIVVEVVKGPGVHSPHVFCFCYDCSQKPNNYIIRIGLNEVDHLPTLGQWVRVVMKQEVHGMRVDYSLWEAQTMGKAKHDTDFVDDNGIRSVLVRVPLKVSGDGFYNQFLGPVSNMGKRLNVPPGNERRQVNAWCRKVMPLSVCSIASLCHWEIALHPEEEWQNEHPFELPAESKTTFKIPFVGSRYRSQQPLEEIGRLSSGASTTTPPALQPSQQQQIQQPMAISKPNQQRNTTNTCSGQPRLSPAMDSSGFGSSASSNTSSQAERDLIDLFDEKCSIGTLKRPTPPPPSLKQSGLMYPHTGVIASVDLKSSGYYVYSNEFDYELNLLTEELLEKGSWIKFNTFDDFHRPTIGQFSRMKKSPFDVRVERNTIYMCVSAVITDDALACRVIDTSYVKNAYDKNRLLKQGHVGKELKLEVVRGKVDGYCWAISKIMKIGN